MSTVEGFEASFANCRVDHGSTERKRQCKRIYQHEQELELVSSTRENTARDDEKFYAETMRIMIARSGADVDDYLKDTRSVDALADIVHDGLVSVWEAPVAGYHTIPDELTRKELAWGEVIKINGLGLMPAKKQDIRKYRGWSSTAHTDPSLHKA